MKIKESIYKQDLSVLGLSTRAENCLYRNGFSTIEDVIDRQEKLYSMRGAGKKVVSEIKRKIIAYANV